MKAIEIMTNIDSNRDLWLQKRKSTVGSSEIVTIAGLNSFKTPLELWAEKTGRIPAQKDNDFMRLGRHMESFIGELFARRTEKKVSKASSLFAKVGDEWATASPDYYILTEVQYDAEGFGTQNVLGVVECKNVNWRSLKDWENDNIPNYAYLQTQWQLGVLGLEHGHVAGLVGASPDTFFTPEVVFSEELFNQLLEKAFKFLDYVSKDIPPEAGAGDIKLLEKITKRDKAKVIELNDAYYSELREFQKIKQEVSKLNAEIKVLESGADTIKAKIIQSMGDATLAFLNDKQVVLNQVNRKPQEATSYWTFSIKDLK